MRLKRRVIYRVVLARVCHLPPRPHLPTLCYTGTVHTTPAGDGVCCPVSALPQENYILLPQTMGSIGPQAVVHFCVGALAYFVPAPEEEGRDPPEHRIPAR